MGNRQILVFAITFWLALLPLPFDTHAKEKRPPSSADSFWDAETEFLKAEKKYYCEGMVYINNGGHPNKKWCQHYANQGHSAALNCLGLLTETQENNPPLAFYYYNFSAQKGYVPAMINLSKVFEKGFGVSKNLPRAFYWYAQAAQKKNPEAMMHLGRFHF